MKKIWPEELWEESVNVGELTVAGGLHYARERNGPRTERDKNKGEHKSEDTRLDAQSGS